MIESGKFNRRIKFQRRATAKDTYGQQAQTWTDAFNSWASIEPLSGRELQAAQAIHAETSHRLEIRYRPGVTADLRAVYQGRIFSVLAVFDEAMAHQKLIVMCSEGAIRGEDDFDTGAPSYLLTSGGDFLTTNNGDRITVA